MQEDYAMAFFETFSIKDFDSYAVKALAIM